MLVAWLLVVALGRFDVVDDAYIVFRYASNLANHLGLVFNPGQRVEGATSLLWAAYLALWARLGVALEPVAVLSALACVLIAAWRTLAVCRLLGIDDWLSATAIVGLLVAPGAVAAQANGLEGALFAAVLAEMLYRLARGQSAALGLAGFVLFAVRPEGAMVAAAFVAAAMLWPREAPPARGPWISGAILLAGVLAITGARLWYFGSPLPNSIVAKSYPVLTYLTTPILASGLYYVGRFALAYAWILAPALLAGWDLRRADAPVARRRAVAASLLSLGVAALAAVRNGGDWMPGFRLFAQYAPAMAVAGAAGLGAVRARVPALPRWTFALLVLPLATTSLVERTANVPARTLARQLFAESRVRPADEDPIIRAYARVANALRDRLSPDDLVSGEAVGLLAYRLPDARILDPTGLVDPFLARHGRPAPPYGHLFPEHTVFVSRPTVMVWHDAGHLESLDPAALNRAYATVCVDRCDALRRAPSWVGTIVMIRRDRARALRPAFGDGVPVEFSSSGLRPAGGPVN